MLNLLSYPPVLRGLFVLLTASATFPIAGAWVIRLNLLPYRFMLMHGALLGGALGLALNLPPLLSVIVVNLLLVLLADLLTNQGHMDGGMATMALMIASLGGASALASGAGVSAQETTNLLWGDLFAVSPTEATMALIFCLGLVLYSQKADLQISALIFDQDVAYTSGVNSQRIHRTLLLITALTVAFAMRVAGALLLDALMLVPALAASVSAHSMKSLYRKSSLIGLIIGVSGFILALATNLPVGASTALTGAVVLGISIIMARIPRARSHHEEL
ncbi:MAG: metal ABC transporter permease [Spirochaetales bacterium]|nr:metal ABC transporter permease [Spirochaetales bacterium]